MADVREANINVVGNWRMPAFGDLNKRAISLKEVGEAVNEMKSGKAPGLDGFPVECSKKGGMAVLEWLARLLNLSLNLSFDMGAVPMHWRGAGIVPLYKGKCECSNSSGISLSVVGKLYGRDLIKRVRAGTDCAIGEEQCRFRQGAWTKCLP